MLLAVEWSCLNQFERDNFGNAIMNFIAFELEKETEAVCFVRSFDVVLERGYHEIFRDNVITSLHELDHFFPSTSIGRESVFSHPAATACPQSCASDQMYSNHFLL